MKQTVKDLCPGDFFQLVDNWNYYKPHYYKPLIVISKSISNNKNNTQTIYVDLTCLTKNGTIEIERAWWGTAFYNLYSPCVII